MNFPTKTKIIINSLVILGILIMPFSNFIPKANAQNISGYIAGLTPVISQMPGCKAAIGSGIKSLFGKNNTDLASTQNFINKVAPGLLSTEVEKAAAESVSIQVNDPVLSGILDMQTLELKSINKSTSATDKNANCLNAIGKAIVKNLIQRMTLSIVNWIQTGNQGNPFFAENISKYFGDIAKTEILGFGLEISDPNKFPFGKAFMQNMARSYNNKFADNATYSLNQMIQATNPEYSAATFSADFSKGGWGAWQAMTQVPANNPLGFQLMASNELGKRLEGTTQSAAQMAQTALDWGNGITGDQRCTDPWNQTKEASDAALKAGDTANVYKNWEYVTPGSVVGHMLTKSMDDSSNSLLSAETLNDAIAAIMDAAIARLSNEMMGTGLANASTDEDTYNNQYSPFSGTSQIEKDFSSYQIV